MISISSLEVAVGSLKLMNNRSHHKARDREARMPRDAFRSGKAQGPK